MHLFLYLVLLFAAPPSFEASMREGLSALQSNDLQLAQQALERATKLQPTSAAAWFLLAQTYAKRSDLKSALLAARRASENAGKDPTILYNLAVFYRDAEMPDQSVAHGLRALAVEDSADVRSLLGKAYLQKKAWPDAIAQLREALRLSPYSEEAIFSLAQAQLQSQDFTSAIAVLEDGRKTFDKSPQIELALGVAYYGQRRFPEAVDAFLRVMKLSPDIPQPYYFLGRVLEHGSGRLPEIIDRAMAFERASPQSPLGYILHARALILQLPATGFPPEATQASELLNRALSIKEDQADAHTLLGQLLEQKKDYASAAVHLERAIVLIPSDPQSHFRLARVYDRLSRTAEAQAQRALHQNLSQQDVK